MHSTKHHLRARLTSPLGRWVTEFWGWWRGELIAMLPPSVRHAVLPRNQRLLLELDGPELVLSKDGDGAIQELERYPLAATDVSPLSRPENAGEVVLCLPRHKALIKELTLPLAAEENLREVLAFEMNRQTPFRAEQVYYDYALATRDVRKAVLTVVLVLVPRQVLEELLAALGRLGFYPDVVTTRPDQGEGLLAVNLIPDQDRKPRPVMARRVNALLGLLALLLLIAAVSLPLWHKRQVIKTLEPELRAAAEQAGEVRGLREEVELLQARSRFLVEKKQSTLMMLQIINELTRILPDDTWIHRLEINGSEVQLQGQSAAAAALIPLIEASSIFHNVRFRSPITQVARSNAERFHLSADIVQGAVP